MKPLNPQPLMKISEAARAIGIHARTYVRWADEGKVPSPIKVGNDNGKGGDLRVVRAEFDAWIEEQKRRRDSAKKGGGHLPRNGAKTASNPPPPQG